MIVETAFDPVGAWWFEVEDVGIPLSAEDWRAVTHVLSLCEGCLKATNALFVEQVVVTAAGGVETEFVLSPGQGLAALLAAIQTAVPALFVIVLRGHTKLNSQEAVVRGAVEFEAHLAGRIQLSVKVFSDDWLPYTLTGTPQLEAASANAPILAEALHALEDAFGKQFNFETSTRYAVVEHYGLDNARDYDGDLVGLE